MAVRSGHGTGAGTPRVEVLPPDELPPATSAGADRPQRSADGRFVRGNTVARAGRLRPGEQGLLGVDRSLPEYRAFARWGRRYSSHRRRELALAHGGEISAGVGAIVESAALAMAASRFLSSRGAQTGDASMLAQAARLSETARQHELAAWELASREAKTRAKPGDAHSAMLEAFATPRQG